MKISKTIIILLMSCMLFSVIPMHAQAATKKIYKTIVSGKSFNVKDVTSTDNTTVYKLSLKHDSIVKINHNYYGGLTTSLYYDKELKKGRDYFDDIFNNAKITMASGTYYFVFKPYDASANIKFTITPYTKYKDRKNYSRATSYKLKTKTWETVTQTPNNNYVRWYRISLTKNQVIHVNRPKNSSLEIKLYNSRMEAPEIFSYTNKDLFITQDKQPKGTYYIKVSENYDDSIYPLWEYTAQCKFRWY